MSFAWHEIHDHLMQSSSTLGFQRSFDALRRAQGSIARFPDRAALLEALHRGPDSPAGKNRILRALITAAQDDDGASDCAVTVLLLALWPGLDVRDGDMVVDKTRFSGFTPGTCTLHETLAEAGIETVIITGTTTNCCSESTARDANQLGYGVIFVTDANAAITDFEHNATLANMAAIFADLQSTERLLKTIGASGAAVAAE